MKWCFKLAGRYYEIVSVQQRDREECMKKFAASLGGRADDVESFVFGAIDHKEP